MYKIESLKMEHLMHAKIFGGRRLWKTGLQLPLKYIKRKKHEIEEQISQRTIYKDSLEYVIDSREKNLKVLEDCLK